jgi:CelD/BcsL family acetyltransferase involved in cellulose biosynthesis
MNFILASDVKDCLQCFASYIKESKETFILAQMDQGHELYAQFREALKEAKVSFIEQEKTHAYVDLKGTWEEYFNGQSKNFRMDSRRKLKRLEKEGRVSLVRTKGENAAQVLEQLKTIAAHCWQAKDNVNIISTPEGFHFYQDVCESSLKGSMLDFTVLTVNDRPVTYMMGIVKDNYYFAFDTAYDKDFEQYSPGLILHNLLMEELYKDQIRVFDFGYSASYKKRWSSQTLLVSDVVIFSKGFQGVLLKIGHRLKSLRTVKPEGTQND